MNKPFGNDDPALAASIAPIYAPKTRPCVRSASARGVPAWPSG
jgi:hypothetical protein